LYLTARCVFTNMTPVGPYRGAGRPEGVNVMERLIDTAARETGADPADLRRRNLIPSDAMPYTAASGQPYDSGDFATILDQALVAADWDGFSARRRASEGRGLLRGRGLVYYVEVTAPQGKEMGGLRFGPDGQVTIVTGTLDYGQGHRAAFAQVLGDKLGVPFDRVTLLQGDSSQLLFGGGTGGSRSIMASGKAILDASDQVIDKGKQLAGHYLEAAPADIEFAGGLFTVAGTDRAIGLADIVVRLADGETLPEGVPAALDSELVSETPPSAFPNGCHVCEVEIDPDTGAVRLDRYTVVDDFGTIVNPMLVEGQVHGGIVQGLGQALMEAAVYDAHGQPLSGSFMDYAMPRADDVPDFRLGFHPVPATTNPLGVKGCGEAGTTGAIPAVINAIADALAQAGAAPVGMPATAEKVWRSLRAVRG
jgi:carbon-monoxide dehydrogenase large subunit